MKNFKLFFSISETSEILGLSKSSVLRGLKSRQIAHIKLGRRTLIPLEAIESLVEKAFENCNIEYEQKDKQFTCHE